LDEKIEIENIDGFPKELEDLQEMWNSFYIDLIATRKSESSPWLCFGLVFKLSNQIFPYKTEIRYNLNDRLIIAHHCEKFSFDRFKKVLREIIQGTLTLDSLQFKIENFDMRHFIFERKPGWSREGLRDEEGWPAHIFRSYLRDWKLINSLQEFDELLIMHEEPYSSIPELTRKYLHGIEIGGVKAGAIYGVIPRYFKLENLKLDETGNVDVDVESHMCINPSDLMISVIIKDESDEVLHSYIVPLDRTQYLRSKETFWVINKHINNDLKEVSEAKLRLVYKKSIVVYEDWIQVIKPSEIVIDKVFPKHPIEKMTYTRIIISEVYDNLPKQVQTDIKKAEVCFNYSEVNEPNLYEACAMYLRKSLATAIIIRFKKDHEEDKLYNDEDKPYRLRKMLELAKQNRYISSEICSNLIRVKWIGDIAVHDYKIRLRKEDLKKSFDLMRYFLDHIFI